jgi:zinc/manganese transport system substrate-binding protein
VIVGSSCNSAYAPEWLADRTRLPVAVLPSTVGGNANAKDLYTLYDDIIGRLLAAAR